MTSSTRKQVPLRQRELDLLSQVKSKGSAESMALFELTGKRVTPDTPDSQTLHALVEAGIKAMQDKALEIGLAWEEAYASGHPEVQAWRTAMRERPRGASVPALEETG